MDTYSINIEAPQNLNGKEVIQSITNLLTKENLCSISTVNADGSPHINTCYFAINDKLEMFILTPAKTKHGNNFGRDAQFAANLFQSGQIFGDKILGIQLFGRVEQLSVTQSMGAFQAYTKKFELFKKWFPEIQDVRGKIQSRFFKLSIDSGKLIDETSFGEEVYIHFNLLRN